MFCTAKPWSLNIFPLLSPVSFQLFPTNWKVYVNNVFLLYYLQSAKHDLVNSTGTSLSKKMRLINKEFDYVTYVLMKFCKLCIYRRALSHSPYCSL